MVNSLRIAHNKRSIYLAVVAAAIVALLLWPTADTPRNQQLDQVLRNGELVMLTRNSASTYYEEAEGPAGLEYDLAKGFADELGVRLTVKIYPGVGELVDALNAGEGDFIAAGFSITSERQKTYRFSHPYNQAQSLVIYHRDADKPAAISDLVKGKIGVNEGASYISHLRNAAEEIPELSWQELDEAGIEDMLQMVTSGELDYSIIDSTDMALNQQFYPYVKAAFPLGEPEPLAWMFDTLNDDSLVQRSREYLYQLEQSNRLQELISRYYDDTSEYDPIEVLAYLDRVRDQLPVLRPLFVEAGKAQDIDWRLLAAMAYQESHWNRNAVSPTGVKGIMMLTLNTAASLGVTNREDPVQSIDGGARYLRILLESLPERIPEPDRLYMALAAYNIGMGHLEDARILTQQSGEDPDNWEAVRKHLPLLSRQKYSETLRYGFARGGMAVHYVDNIQSYYDILNWMDSRNHPLLTQSDEHAMET